VQRGGTRGARAARRVEGDELGDAGLAHDGDGLVHAARLRAHVLLALRRKVRDLLRGRARAGDLGLLVNSQTRTVAGPPCRRATACASAHAAAGAPTPFQTPAAFPPDDLVLRAPPR
jgi:hypothetical protein